MRVVTDGGRIFHLIPRAVGKIAFVPGSLSASSKIRHCAKGRPRDLYARSDIMLNVFSYSLDAPPRRWRISFCVLLRSWPSGAVVNPPLVIENDSRRTVPIPVHRLFNEWLTSSEEARSLRKKKKEKKVYRAKPEGWTAVETADTEHPWGNERNRTRTGRFEDNEISAIVLFFFSFL